MKKIANNKKILSSTQRVSKAFEIEAEEILLHAESAIKENVPAKLVKSSLEKLETLLDKEGIESLFDKKITRENLRKSASLKADKEEVDEFVDVVATAVVDEFEDILKDTEEVVDEIVASFDEDEDEFEVESRFKSYIEKDLKSKGIHCKLDRKIKKVASKDKTKAKTKTKYRNSIIEKIKSLI